MPPGIEEDVKAGAEKLRQGISLGPNTRIGIGGGFGGGIQLTHDVSRNVRVMVGGGGGGRGRAGVQLTIKFN